MFAHFTQSCFQWGIFDICDTIKGNQSHVKRSQFSIGTLSLPISQKQYLWHQLISLDHICYFENITYITYVTWSREMSHVSKFFNFEFLTPLSDILKMLYFDANPTRIGGLVSELWAIHQYTKHNIIQNNLNSFFAHISKTIYATSDSFPLIISHMWCDQAIYKS